MSTLSPERNLQDHPTRRRPRWRRPLVVAVVVAVVVAMTVALAAVVRPLGNESGVDGPEPLGAASDDVSLPGPGETSPSDTTTDAEATALAEAYIDARNAYDTDQARALVAEDFVTTEHPNGYGDLVTMERAFENFEALGFEYANVECTPRSSHRPAVGVRCDFDWITELHRIGDHEPTPAWLLVTVKDGEIVLINRGEGDHEPWWNPFEDFLAAEHPAFASDVVRALELEPMVHRRVMNGMPEYLALYAESLAGGPN